MLSDLRCFIDPTLDEAVVPEILSLKNPPSAPPRISDADFMTPGPCLPFEANFGLVDELRNQIHDWPDV
jgi:hypothetical protein